MRRPEVGIIALAMLASACAIPTDSPNWDMTWNLPVPDNNGMSIPLSSFLPSGVSTVGNPPSAFSITVSSIPAITRSLGAQCVNSTPACPSGNFPFPGFTAPAATTTVTLAASTSLNTAVLASGSQIVVNINNGFSFDPLKPPGSSSNGNLTLTISNGSSTTLGQCTLVAGSVPSGCTTPTGTSTLPAGSTTALTIPLGQTINTAQPITVTMTMTSPSSGTTSVNQAPSTQFITATPSAVINASSATVTIAAQPLSSSPTPVDLSSIDNSIANRIVDDGTNRGTMFLTVVNPLTIGANATITFQSPAGTPASDVIAPITKNIVLPAATNASTASTSTLEINLTGHELHQMFGHNLDVVFGGTTGAGTVTVTPALKITATSRIQVNFNVKEVE